MNEKDPFLVSIATALDDSSGVDTTTYLLNFRRDLNADQFRACSVIELADIFRQVWRLLLVTAASESSVIRIASYRATGAFLTRLLPFYPEAVHKSFSDVALLTTIDITSSVIVASSFGLISKYVAQPFLARSVLSWPIFHHFTSTDPGLSETFPIIISKLGHLGVDTLKDWLHYFLVQVEEASSRYYIKSIAAIVGHRPSFFVEEILAFVEAKISVFLTLLAFLFGQHPEVVEDLDLMNVATAAVSVIGNEESLPMDIDSSLQILAIQSKSFRVEIGELVDGFLPIRVSNGGLSAAGDLNFATVSNRPAVYGLRLPRELRSPRDGDSSSVLVAKFHTLASDVSVELTHTLSVLEPFFSQRYSNSMALFQSMTIDTRISTSCWISASGESLPRSNRCPVSRAISARQLRR
jgi:hypothetical protein